MNLNAEKLTGKQRCKQELKFGIFETGNAWEFPGISQVLETNFPDFSIKTGIVATANSLELQNLGLSRPGIPKNSLVLENPAYISGEK